MSITISNLSKQVKKFLKNDWDYIIVISGDAGVGKSTLTVKLGRLVDKEYDFERNNIYSRRELKDKLWNLPTKSFLNVDEAINIIYRRDFFQRKQKNLLKDLDVVRDRNMCFCFLIPSFWDLDSKVLNSGRIKIWIHLDERGRGYIFRPDKNPFNPDPWNKKLNFKKLKDWYKGVHPMISPNYLEDIRFEPLEPDDFKQYKRIKAIKKKKASAELDAEELEKGRIWIKQRDRLIKWIVKEYPSVKQETLGEVTGLTQSHISRIISS